MIIWRSRYLQVVLTGTLLCVAFGSSSPTHADVTSSGLGTTVNQPAAGVFNITGGSRPGGGTNLFHSFGNFSLNTSESANFLNNSGLPTTNILSRVTGGNPSSIFGTINTLNFPGANLFLMNPAGIIFGPTAQLNVSGSFHATTADYIKLGTDGIFYSDPARPTVLSVAPPSAFGFLSANPAPIEVQTGGIDFNTFLPAALLQVPEGQTLSLVGGNAPGSDTPGVSIGALDGSTPGYLLAPAGRVNLVSVGSPGEAVFDGTGFNVDGFGQLGGVMVGPGSIVDGKEIFIRGGRLVIDGGVLLPGAFAFELSFVGLSPLPDGGEVNIKVTDDVTMTGTSFELLTFAPPGIFVYTGDPLGNSLSPPAKVPDIKIDAGSVFISGFAGIQVQRNAPGPTGNVSINANRVTVGSGGSIVLTNKIKGEGPSLTINAKEVDVSGDGSDSPFGFEGIAVQGVRHPLYLADLGSGPITDPDLITADSGNITINASDSLSVRGLGQITTDSRNFGRAGDITISAGNVLVEGTGDPQSALIGSQSAFAGDSGNIAISATGTITAKDGARITSASLGSGNAGNVTLTAGGPITLTGSDARVVGATFQPPDSQLNDLFSEMFFQDFDSIREEMGNPEATMMEVLAYLQGRGDIQIPDLDLTPGDAGTISVATPLLTLNSGTRIETSTGWEGNAGGVLGNVGSLFVNEGAAIRSRSGVEFLDGTFGVGPGNAGSIDFTATETISVSGSNSVISTATFGDGNAGNISLSANQVDVHNSGRVSSESGGTLAGQSSIGSGNAGQITVTTPTLAMADGGRISVNTLGSGNAGNISLDVRNFTQTGGARVDSSTSGSGAGGTVAVTADERVSISGPGSGLFSTTSSTGDAGEVSVSTPTLTMADGGTISVATSGVGNAGNVLLDVRNFSLTGGAQILSSTISEGQGGNVTLSATDSISIFGQGTGLFSTAASTGNAGRITIAALGSTPVSKLTMGDNGKISVETLGQGSAGSILLNVNALSLTGGSQVVSSTSGSGQGGSVTATATEVISISGQGTGLLSTASSTGNAGEVIVSTPTLTMNNGGTISVATSSIGNAGNIALNVTDFTQTGGAQVVSSTTGTGAGGNLAISASNSIAVTGIASEPSGFFSTASASGNAGEITVSAPKLTMGEGGTISVATTGVGNAGNVALNVNEFIQIGGARVESSTSGAGAGGRLDVAASEAVSISGARSGLFSTASSTGNAGQVVVSAPSLAMSNGATISVATSGSGNAGNVLLNTNNYNLTEGAQIVSSTSGAGQGGSVTANAANTASISGENSGMFSNASGSGAGGTINIQAGQLQITDFGVISANSTGTATATAGNVNIVAGELVQMQNGSITTESTLADGGNISITTTGSLVHLNKSQITTSVQSGVGSGGNISIGSEFVLFNNSEIRADAFGGPGGNITIVANTFLPDSSVVSASSALSTPGTIAIEATFTDVSGSVAQLPETPLEATELLRASCAARFAGGKASSLVVAGRDGLPLQPGSLLPSPLYMAETSPAQKSITQETPLQFTLLGSKDRISSQYSLLPNVKCSL